jgi:cell wall-associated NlpC family hydrolase
MSVNTYPTVGFDPDASISSLLINGSQLTADVTEAVSQAQLERVMVGASTITLTIEDPFRTLVNSQIAQVLVPTAPGAGLAPYGAYTPTTCSIEDSAGTKLVFALCSVEKQGDELILTFEDLWINTLRYSFAQQAGYYTASGTMTRADFMVAVIRKAIPLEPIPIIRVPDTFPGIEQIENDTGDSQWGTTAAPNEDAWTCLTRLANAVQWRCFSNGTAIVIGPDQWLLSYPPAATFVENTGGVDSIDFTYDLGQATTNATVHANTALLTFPPGVPINLTRLGVANGLWLASDISRSLFFPDATIGALQPQPSLTETQLAATAAATGATSSSTATAGAGGSPAAQNAVTYALEQVGKPYVWGGTGPGGYDCSGLCYAAYQSAGITIPHTSQAQWAGIATKITDMSTLLPGDLIFYAGSDGTTANPGHVVMYIGGGQVVEAYATGTNIRTDPTIPQGYIGAARPAP